MENCSYTCCELRNVMWHKNVETLAPCIFSVAKHLPCDQCERPRCNVVRFSNSSRKLLFSQPNGVTTGKPRGCLGCAHQMLLLHVVNASWCLFPNVERQQIPTADAVAARKPFTRSTNPATNTPL